MDSNHRSRSQSPLPYRLAIPLCVKIRAAGVEPAGLRQTRESALPCTPMDGSVRLSSRRGLPADVNVIVRFYDHPIHNKKDCFLPRRSPSFPMLKGRRQNDRNAAAWTSLEPWDAPCGATKPATSRSGSVALPHKTGEKRVWSKTPQRNIPWQTLLLRFAARLETFVDLMLFIGMMCCHGRSLPSCEIKDDGRASRRPVPGCLCVHVYAATSGRQQKKAASRKPPSPAVRQKKKAARSQPRHVASLRQRRRWSPRRRETKRSCCKRDVAYGTDES